MPTWIDLREFRAKLRFEQVLRYYGIEINRKGEQHQGRCPLPDHGGSRDSFSFSANLERGIFQCFGCKARGNVLEFAVLMEKVSLNNGRGFRDVAVKLQTELYPDEVNARPSRGKRPESKALPPVKAPETIVNPSLDFELKGLEGGHRYFTDRKLCANTVNYFGLGYCSRGLLRGRIAIPLQDQEGHLIGYAGRVVDDAAVTRDNPQDIFPVKREREGKALEFRKTLFLYNGFRIKTPSDELIVVQDFSSVWWLHQAGFPHVIALMGSDCSEMQAELIVSSVQSAGRVWLLPSSDGEGERLARLLLFQIAPHRFVRWVRLKERCQPTDLSAEQLSDCFAESSQSSDP